MYEHHEREQYFFDRSTVEHLATAVEGFIRPCCLCAPLVGQELIQRGVPARVLDIDERFSFLEGFRQYDLYRPEHLPEQSGLILCDPPFFKVSLAQLFIAVRILSHFNHEQPLLICYLRRRSANLMGTFARFNLVPTGYCPSYLTVQPDERNEIEFFSNIGEEFNARLAGLQSSAS